MPPSRRKIYIPLSLGHLIYTAGDKCMRENACFTGDEHWEGVLDMGFGELLNEPGVRCMYKSIQLAV